MSAGPSLLLVAFHTYPDPAVGAKRVSELANHLVAEGWRVTAISQVPAQPDASRVLLTYRASVPVRRRLLDIDRVRVREVAA